MRIQFEPVQPEVLLKYLNERGIRRVRIALGDGYIAVTKTSLAEFLAFYGDDHDYFTVSIDALDLGTPEVAHIHPVKKVRK